MDNQGNQQKVWEEIAEPWSKFRKRTPDEVLNFLKDKEGKILDLGCGSGRNFIKQNNLEFYGVDFSKNMLKLAQKDANAKKIKVKLFNSDLTNLTFEDDFFDSCIFISTLHCIEGKDNRKRVLEEIYRVLKSEAEVLITVWDKENSSRLNKIEEKEGYVKWGKDGKDHLRYYYCYDKTELKALLEEIGFQVININLAEQDSKHSRKNLVFVVRKI